MLTSLISGFFQPRDVDLGVEVADVAEDGLSFIARMCSPR